MEDRENLKNGLNFAFVLPKIGRKKSLHIIDFIAEQTRLNRERGEERLLKNLWVPEIVDIDYSDYAKEKMHKGALFGKHYKDGILLVNKPSKGNEGLVFFEIARSIDETSNPAGKSVFNIFQESFCNYGQIDWNHKNFDEQVVIYIVQPQVSKNTAARLVFKQSFLVCCSITISVARFSSSSDDNLAFGSVNNILELFKVPINSVLAVFLIKKSSKPLGGLYIGEV